MRKSKFTEEQIAYGLRQVEGGSPVADVCRQLGVSEATSTSGRRDNAHVASASCGSCGRSRTRMRASNGSSPTCSSTNTSSPRPCEKESEPHTAPAAGRLSAVVGRTRRHSAAAFERWHMRARGSAICGSGRCCGERDGE